MPSAGQTNLLIADGKLPPLPRWPGGGGARVRSAIAEVAAMMLSEVPGGDEPPAGQLGARTLSSNVDRKKLGAIPYGAVIHFTNHFVEQVARSLPRSHYRL